jgi:GAF domain-containing protein
MAEGFGARLQLRREQQHIDLSVIAEQTKIKRSLLEALERDDLSHWPTGIFRRAWVRSYAQAIGLDGDQTVREFLEVHPDPDEIAATTTPPAPEPTGFRGMIGAAFGSLSKRMRATTPDDLSPIPVHEPQPAVEHMAIESPPPLVPPVRESPAKIANRPPVVVERSEFDLPSLARICTKFGQATNPKDVQPLLQEVAGILDAAGLIVWLWHSTAAVLRPALVHGYSAGVIARLPAVTRDADNPTAASFKSGKVREVAAGGGACGALVVPLLLRSRCIGVLAIELQPGRELTDSARAVATIIAAAVAQLVNRSQPAEARSAQSKRRANTFSPVSGTV